MPSRSRSSQAKGRRHFRVSPGTSPTFAPPDPRLIFERDWQDAFWGVHYRRLLAIKKSYDPDGLFFVHHGVNSEAWSDDGFTRLRA